MCLLDDIIVYCLQFLLVYIFCTGGGKNTIKFRDYIDF